MRHLPRLPLLALAVLFVACSGDPKAEPLPPLDIPAGCNPVAADWDCMLPYPSDAFLKDDPSLPSGRRIALPDAAKLKAQDGEPIDFTELHPADGFSLLPQIVALFPQGVDDANLVFLTGDVTRSLGDESPTVLLNADTGERVLHFAELDPRATDDAHRAFFVRPLVRLDPGVRYIVAIRRLKDPSGAAVAPPEAFRRIRDGQTESDPVLAPLAARYDSEIFPVLADAGVDRAELQLAWDFTTETLNGVAGDMFTVRDDVVARLEESPPAVTITKVEETPDVDAGTPHLRRRIHGTIEVPLYLESTDVDALLHRGADGKPTTNGTVQVPFEAQIPLSLDGSSPGRALQYGHGFFGSRREIEYSFATPFVDRTQMVSFAVDWWGMSTPDAMAVGADILENINAMLSFTDRVHQAMANQIALSYAIQSSMADLPDFQVNGARSFDPSAVYYYGISQGHILGGTYLALAPKIDKGVFSVGGAGVPFMMFRADPFSDFLGFIAVRVPDPLAQRKLVTLTSTTFDRVDPITYAPFVLHGRTETDPATRQVLQHTGLGDPQVPNPAAFIHARSMGLTELLPTDKDVAGLPESEGPLDSALVVFDFNLPAPLPGTYSDLSHAEDNPVHEGVRRLDASIAQVDAFLRPGGEITNTCDGACDPE